MTQSLESLVRRTEAMQGIRGIVHTMKTLSAINRYPYEQAARSINDWRDTILDGLHAFAKAHGALEQSAAARALPVVVALGSDQGLCGNYNETVAQTLAAHLATHEQHAILCIGAEMQDAIHDVGLKTERALLTPASVDGLGRVVSDLITRIDAVRADQPHGITVTLAFTERKAHGQQAAVLRQVLPLAPEVLVALANRPWTSRSLPHFDMTPTAILAALLRHYLFASLFYACAEALVTENAARFARMQQAEKNIDDQLDELASTTRTTRQSAITEELLDVIAGFEALKHRRARHVDPAKPGIFAPSDTLPAADG
ncbi:F0F1 ATP synthase subunit gamma [Alcaligenaceae bacterium]|nr:F0F1 ATP synthase subunit gamma [Alcaligenaceae bacterium]